MSSVRRPLLTATAAGTLLGALWFVPSAKATAEDPAREQRPATTSTTQARAVTAADSGAAPRLADTGSFDSTPYVVGGTFCLAMGAGFVVYSVRRDRFAL